MPEVSKREPRGEATDVFGRFDRMFDEWARMMSFRPVPFPRWWDAGDVIRVEEYRQDGTLVIRADLPGIDPAKDVQLTVSDGMLHIDAERRDEKKTEEKGYVRQELRYGLVSRSLPLPAGVTEGDLTATYKNGSWRSVSRSRSTNRRRRSRSARPDRPWRGLDSAVRMRPPT